MTNRYFILEKQIISTMSKREMLLSILICTLPSRQRMFDSLVRNLSKQVSDGDFYDEVELVSDADINKSIGDKRNDLLGLAQGKFIVFIDDDDDVDIEYISLIINTIKSNNEIDCIGMKGIITFDGGKEQKWVISKQYGKWFERDGVYYRTPNHISPVERSIALSKGFTNKNVGEDYDYSMAILPLLKNEVMIDKEIYHYRYITNK
jgi:hypothetical protein